MVVRLLIELDVTAFVDKLLDSDERRVRVLEFKEILLLLKKLRLKCGSSFLIPAPGICQTIEP